METSQEICQWKRCFNPVRENPYKGHAPKFCSVKCKNKKMVDDLRHRRKQELVNYLGGKCNQCGYSKCLAALHFHHLRDKSFNLTSGITLKLDLIKDEVDKCILLCGNCHAELHHDCAGNGCVAQLEERLFEA